VKVESSALKPVENNGPIATATSAPPPSPTLDEPGDNPVDAPIVCVLTRFRLRSFRHLLPTYLDFRRVMKQAKTTETPGLLRSVFLIEGPKTFYSLSIWSNSASIPMFGTNVPYHVVAGNSVFGLLRGDENNRPEIWSTKWRLSSVSKNLNWKDFDLRELIIGMSK
jgi:hypothetical protein